MLLKKIFNDFKRNKGQFCAVFLIMFLGVTIFTGLNSVWYGMENTTNQFYNQSNMGDYWVKGNKITDDLQASVRKIEGVTDTERSFVGKTVLDSQLDVTLEVNFIENELISKNEIVQGANFNAKEDGIWIDHNFAKEKGYKIGDNIEFNMNSWSFSKRILGFIRNPQYLYYIAETNQLLPDYKKYGYAYIGYSQIPTEAREYFPFNCLQIKSQQEKPEELFTAINKVAAEKNASLIVTERESQTSNRMVQDKIKQFKSLASLFPLLFLLVCLLVTITTMTRFILNQKEQIGVLLATGFEKKKIKRHYLLYSEILCVCGTVCGGVVGMNFLPKIVYRSLYMYDFPNLQGKLPSNVLISFIAAITFFFLIVYVSQNRLLSKTTIELMRPSVAKNHETWAEKRGFWKHLSFKSKWTIKDILLNKFRSLTIVLSVIICVMLMIAAFGLRDALNDIIPWQYAEVYKYSEKLLLSDNVDEKNSDAIIKSDQAEKIIEKQIEVIAQNSQVSSIQSLTVLNSPSFLIQLTDSQRKSFSLSDKGLAISYRLAEMENIKLGDTVKWRIVGDDKWYTSEVSGIYRMPINQGFTTTFTYYGRIGLPTTPSALLIKNNINSIDVDTNDRIQRVQRISSDKSNIQVMIKSMLNLSVLLIGAAVLLMVIVQYNLGMLSLEERKRELVTLGIIGFSKKMLRSLFRFEILQLTGVGIVLGIPFGYALLNFILKMMSSRTDMMMIFQWSSLIYSVLGTLFTAVLINLYLSRKLNKLDFVTILKE